MKKMIVGGAVLALCGLSSTAVMADSDAVLAQSVGKVMIDSGKGFFPVKVGAVLNDGDRVVALKASSATINFAQGCSLALAENNLVTISKDAGCKSEIVAVNRAADTSTVAAVGDTQDQGSNLGGYIAAAGGVVALGLGINELNDDDDKKVSGQ